MRRSGQALLNLLLVLTLVGIGIIIWILLFNQKAVPQLTVRDGKDAVVDYQKIDRYIDAKFGGIPLPKDGKDAGPVDYNLINSYIDGRMALIPHPRNGVDGEDGDDGMRGKSCTTSQTDTGAVIACEDGTSAIIRNGNDAYIELRCNDTKNRWEVKYTADGNWSVLNNKSTKCTITPSKE